MNPAKLLIEFPESKIPIKVFWPLFKLFVKMKMISPPPGLKSLCMRTTRIHVVINTHTFTFFDVILAFTTDVSGSGSDTFTFLQKKYFKLSGTQF